MGLLTLGEDWVTVACGEVDGIRARRAAVPDPNSLLQRPGKCLGFDETRAEPTRPCYVLALPEHAEQLIPFTIAVPLIGGGHMKQLGLRRAIALADYEFEPPTGQVVERRIIFECPDRIEQTQRCHCGEQADLRCSCRDVAEHHRRR